LNCRRRELVDLEIIKRKYKKIIIWGGGNTFLACSMKELPIAYIIDSDKKKQGSVIKGLYVEAPDKLLSEDMEKVCIIILSVFWREIVSQIENMRITAEVLLPSMIEPNPFYKQNYEYGRSYGLFAEDAIIRGISMRYGIDIKHYIDIGANHPVYGNSTYLFYLDGASGCLVEPNSSFIEKIKINRPRDTVWNLGVGSADNDGLMINYYCIGELNTRNTFSEEVAEYYTKQGYEVCSKPVQVISLNSLMNNFGKKVDYINIDVEGYEYEI